MTNRYTVQCYDVRIPFTMAFKHASHERSETETVCITITDSDGHIGYGEGCPRDYVTGETISSALTFISSQLDLIQHVTTYEELCAYVHEQHALIDKNPAAWCAIELALLDCLAQQQRKSVEELLGIENRQLQYRYSAILGDAQPEQFTAIFQRYRHLGFTDFKIKLARDRGRDQEKLACMRTEGEHIRVRADANNMWDDSALAIKYLADLQFPFTAIEEPLQSKRIDDLQAIAKQTGIKIICDESILRREQLKSLYEKPATWIINARVSKYGGLIRSLALITEAAANGIAIVVGAHVGETSLLTRAALILADVAQQKLIAQEGGFSTHLLSDDPFVPHLKLGQNGLIDERTLAIRGQPGLGMKPTSPFETYAHMKNVIG